MVDVSLRGLSKSFGSHPVVHGVDLDIQDGEFVVLVGPSGCGKSTILRMVAGLEDITAGELILGGIMANDLSPKDRNLAMVFQDYALYPNMTVASNIGFGLKMNKVPAEARERRIREIAQLLQLSDYLERKPRALSGGQRQRVAMGRALARSAQLFLFDEPLSNLDAQLRTEVRTQIKILHQKLGMTSIFVTHDQTEAMTLADKIVCLHGGKIAQTGTPEELYNEPKNLFVASFIGSPQINIIEAELDGDILTLSDGQTLSLAQKPIAKSSKRRVLVGIRPEDITDESRIGTINKSKGLRVDYLISETLGSDTFIIGQLGGARVTARCAPTVRHMPGSTVLLHANAERLHLFDPETGRRM
ncbi:ABC transporter ATP-binding protein [Mesorhizobium neociceri]|uniref:sn-glycerol-3-phosphate ABC transporter ATP-binding protein UgpC n=1 Tax=Mesorhizobium neociceri TaxID=1307853 RepID=A0A838BAD6_9HYPH|nr:sn-glycerol-3-phosphate ABC transporter ATP-binding protein UgpC [Mesorhizobium neociceri]MBA1142320.1 sn-glycerol-3-phosphate ABC transporter ATP-binding protein UgpC [Mesorhizobium neociceri]